MTCCSTVRPSHFSYCCTSDHHLRPFLFSFPSAEQAQQGHRLDLDRMTLTNTIARCKGRTVSRSPYPSLTNVLTADPYAGLHQQDMRGMLTTCFFLLLVARPQSCCSFTSVSRCALQTNSTGPLCSLPPDPRPPNIDDHPGASAPEGLSLFSNVREISPVS